MRRTATLTLFAEEKENNLANIDHLFSVNKKCKLELGIVNNVSNYIYTIKDKNDVIHYKTINYKQKYGQTIWFPLGIYVMFNPSISHGIDGVTISMQLKDKMCLLNGDLGGQIHSAVDFSTQDQMVDINAQSIEKNPVLVYNIIKQLVNHWGNELLHKIIITEVPLQIKRVVRWMGIDPIYLVQQEGQKGGWVFYTSQEDADKNKKKDTEIKTFKKGQDVGYQYTDFVYPGELVCNAGDTVTSVLDKLIGIMGNYEYFYDVEGNFRFQQKQNYLNMTNTAYWTKEQQSDKKVGNLPTQVYNADVYKLSRPVYSFIENKYTTTFNNSLSYNNIKNDFVVWGSRKSTNTNITLPCRFHLAIDKKPSLHKHDIILFEDDYQTTRAVAWKEGDEEALKITRTSIDWREQIYYQMLEDERNGTGENTELNNTYFQYYAELKEEFPKFFDLRVWTEKLKELEQQYKNNPNDQLKQKIEKFKAGKKEGENFEAAGYKTDMELHPEQINYYLDFIDEDSQLGQYSVNNIGRRSKIIEDNNEGINCVFEPDIPDIVFIDTNKYTQTDLTDLQTRLTKYGQVWSQIDPKIFDLFDVGGILNSCFEKIKDLLYQYTHVNNTISITTLPIYNLQPNTRITVEDKVAGIEGDFIIQSISLPLDISSTMTINAYKALQKI